MFESILQEVASLTLAEKQLLIKEIKAAVARELGVSEPSSPTTCPYCGSASFVRKGHGRHGEQRWLCKSCQKTFSAKTMGLLAYSKLPPEIWASYVECMVCTKTLEECADACHVCLKTSWFMRMRLCEVMSQALQPFRTGPSVSWQIDGTYLDESLSGNRARSRTPMPRRAHRNGHAVHIRGISNLKVCIVCGVNDLGDAFCRLADRGRPSDSALATSLAGLGAANITTDDLAGYSRILPRLGASSHTSVKAKRATDGELGMVNALHQRIKGFLVPFHGVSTKWLPYYLAWFLWTEQVRHSDVKDTDVLAGQAAAGHYSNTFRQLISQPQPFWDYWERNGSMSTVV